MGLQVDTVKKQGAGYNAQRMGKLENETEELSHAKVEGAVKKAIMQGRLAKKMTQAQLAQAINEKPQVINEYECGKAIPNPQVCTNTRAPPPPALKRSLPSTRAPHSFVGRRFSTRCRVCLGSS